MSLHDRQEARAPKNRTVDLAGRGAELARLQSFVSGSERSVLHLHGIPGIGKTLLLDSLSGAIASEGVRVVRIDARWCEPSPVAFCGAISRKLGIAETEDVDAVLAALSAGAGRTLLMIDSYESFRLLDSWVRQVFLPSLDDSVRTI